MQRPKPESERQNDSDHSAPLSLLSDSSAGFMTSAVASGYMAVSAGHNTL